MKFSIATLLLIAPISLIAQQSRTYKLPKYSPSYHRSTRDMGPRPGSKVIQGQDKTTFKRIYAEPAALRLLVRTRCDTRPGDKALIERAKRVSLENGPPVQLDWERITSDKVSFYAVVQTKRKIVTMDLSAVDDKYKSGKPRTNTKESWEIRKLNIGSQGKVCIDEKDMPDKELKLAIQNFLNQVTLQNYRRPSTE